jgi:hypothetical protein
MPMCDACKTIVGAKRGAPGHDGLKFVGYGEGYQPFGQSKVSFKNYDCQACGQKWQYEDDKNDSHAGWSNRE